MPVRPKRKCTMPGCHGLASGHARYCEVCHPKAQRAEFLRRGSAHSRGYGNAWVKMAKAVIAGEPLCRECSRQGRVTAAECVDHILPKARGGTDDIGNLQPLCNACHGRKTVREDGGFGNSVVEKNVNRV